MKIQNPILKGFNPDPSICRVADDFYIATSTFEWFPGVQIHHSKDLVHWQLIKRPLDRVSQIDMRGNLDSGGVWAPCLTHADDKFWLVYSDVKSFITAYKDVHNYVVTADEMTGDWSDRIYLNSAGFDPSMFHDDDGKKYLVYMVWDHRIDNHSFYGIEIQEYSHDEKKLIGEKKLIFKGSAIGGTEGPHIYKKDSYYYLMVAEGGTGYEHVVTVARASSLLGEYQLHPENPILTSRDDPALPLQKAGHASVVPVRDDLWALVHLCGRPLTQRGDCPLGRETAMQRLIWENGWPYLEHGVCPQNEVKSFGLPLAILPDGVVAKDDFDDDTMNIHFQTPRMPIGEKASLSARKGHLRLYGNESLNATFSQAHLARRWQSLHFTAKTKLAFQPETFQQAAGLTAYYNTQNWFFLQVMGDEQAGRVLQLSQMQFGTQYFEHLSAASIALPMDAEYVYLSLTVVYDKMSFAYSLDGAHYITVSHAFDSALLSDDYITNNSAGHFFTGAFVGLACVDVSGEHIPADFDYFYYQEEV